MAIKTSSVDIAVTYSAHCDACKALLVEKQTVKPAFVAFVAVRANAKGWYHNAANGRLVCGKCTEQALKCAYYLH